MNPPKSPKELNFLAEALWASRPYVSISDKSQTLNAKP